MKRILLLLFIAGFAVTSQAQDTTATSRQANKKAERKQFMADLNLSPEQAKQFKSVNREFKEKADAIKNNESLNRNEKKEQFAVLAKERSEKLNTFLTAEQMAALKKQRKSGHQKHHQTK